MSRGVELYENFYAKRDIREHATVGKIIVYD